MSFADQILAGSGRAQFEFIAENRSVSAGHLAAQGSRWYTQASDEPVLATVLSNDSQSVALVLGAVLTGASLVSIPLPGRAASLVAYSTFVQHALDLVGASRIVARDDIAHQLASAGINALGHQDIEPTLGLARSGDAFELTQFSSGATAAPKPILMPAELLAANISAILDRVEPSSGDVTVSWLPLSHDMGLIGMLLSSLAAVEPSWTSGGQIVLMPPESFLRDPSIWLRSVAKWRGTFTAAPDFGYRLAARASVAGLDLGSMRHAIVGGEVIRASTLSAVEQALRPAGLASTALAPAYGLAELGLAAVMTGPSERWRVADQQDREIASAVNRIGWSCPVSSGLPLAGYSVSIEPETERVRIYAPSIGLDAITRQSLCTGPGYISTNDTGFKAADGAVFISGRVDDVIVVHGRNIPAIEVEAAVSEINGVRPGRVTAVGLPTGEWVVVAEHRFGLDLEDLRRLRAAVRRSAVAAASASPDHVALIEPGHLPMTSSGKTQRFAVRSRWLAGDFDR